MTASEDLLRQLEQDPTLAGALAWPGDFDIDRRDPVEAVVLPSGAPLHPMAGDGAGGTYFLCGEAVARLMAAASCTSRVGPPAASRSTRASCGTTRPAS
jgi:hypothetical protein